MSEKLRENRVSSSFLLPLRQPHVSFQGLSQTESEWCHTTGHGEAHVTLATASRKPRTGSSRSSGRDRPLACFRCPVVSLTRGSPLLLLLLLPAARLMELPQPVVKLQSRTCGTTASCLGNDDFTAEPRSRTG